MTAKQDFHAAEERLCKRHEFLKSQVREVEEALGHHWYGLRVRERDGPPASGALAELLDERRREISRIESSLRRIRERVYDCCITCGATIPIEELERHLYQVNCQTCSQGYPPDYFSEVRVQHRGIRRFLRVIVAEVGALVQGYRDEIEQPIAHASILALLTHLEKKLDRHFSAEERGGQMDGAVVAAPQFAKAVETLRAEHASYRTRMAEVVAGSAAAGGSVPKWERVEELLADLASDIVSHEEEEDRILRKALVDDVGVKD